jgi:hypothetical protein
MTARCRSFGAAQMIEIMCAVIDKQCKRTLSKESYGGKLHDNFTLIGRREPSAIFWRDFRAICAF